MASRHIVPGQVERIPFDDPYVKSQIGRDPYCHDDFAGLVLTFNAGVMLMRLDLLEQVDMVKRMEGVLAEQIARLTTNAPLLWTDSVNQAAAVIAMYNHTTFADHGFNCRPDATILSRNREKPGPCFIKHAPACWV